MLGSDVPSWKQLFGPIKPADAPYFQKDNMVWMSQSAVSIKLIIKALREVRHKENINFWLPDYFCADTLNVFADEKVTAVFYPVSSDLEPDWKGIKENYKEQEMDVFLFVHYFGIPHDISRASVFCKQRGAVLIEDCAHCLYDYEKIGSKGDFALFSPHKLLPVNSGAILVCNHQEGILSGVWENVLNEAAAQEPSGNIFPWRIKKAVQKLFKLRRSTAFTVEPHIAGTEGYGSGQRAVGIDKWSKALLQSYDYEKLKRAAFIRRLNLKAVHYIVQSIDARIKPLIPEDAFCPYYAVFSLENVDNKQQAVELLEKKGLLVTFWPELPKAVLRLPYDSRVKKLSENTIVIPVHQGINSENLIGSALGKRKTEKAKYSFVPLSEKNTAQWDSIISARDNIPQDRVYGQIRAECSGDSCEDYLIVENGEVVGRLQAIVIRKFGIKCGVRINRGPILRQEDQPAEKVFEIMNAFKRKQGIYPVLWAPNLTNSPQNMHLAYSFGWKGWNLFGFTSGILSLESSPEDIRKGLDSKWRNQLVSSEKKGFTVVNDNSKYQKALQLYLEDQKEKGFEGVPNAILTALFTRKESPLELYYVARGDEILAFDIIYLQGHIGHYLVGWNSFEGRKNYLNNLLLFHIAISLKEKGATRFDLGGIEYLDTEEIAKFKDGMRPEHYQLLGEFIKL